MRRRAIGAFGALALVAGALAVAAPAQARPAANPIAASIANANALLGTHGAEARVSSSDSFAVYRATRDAVGSTHVRYSRTYAGLKVLGGDIVVHSSANGGYAGISNGLSAPLRLSTTPRVSATAAANTARANFQGTITSVASSQLIVDASSGVGRLAWETVVRGWARDGQTPSTLHVVTDAVSGNYLGAWDAIDTVVGTGNSIYSGTVSVNTTLSGSTYSMTDPTHGGNTACDMKNKQGGQCQLFTDANNVWGNGTNSDRQSAAVDAYYGAALTFDYYVTVHGRNGIFNNGTGVPSRVHYGKNYVNAFWDGAQMTYGDGASNSRPLVAIDVAGHEMSHGVTENSVPGGLTYSGESGGLNEATSDIFGTMVEFFANNASDPGDYLIGEEIDINGNGTPLRYMYNPPLDGASHGCWSTTTNSINVHYSSGVANHFFFDLAEGTGATAFGTSPVCGSAPAVTGIGRAKAELIWYRALDVYFTSNTSYVNNSNPSNTARAYSLHATQDLYGLCSTEYQAVQAAWTAVNVAGSDAAC